MRWLVVALTVLAVAATAPAAFADDAWLWACRGPDGQPLGSLGDRAQPSGTCEGEAGLLARSGSSWQFQMPPDTVLNAVRIRRAGDLGSGGTYRLEAARPLETITGETVPAADNTFPAEGSRVAFGVTCDGECAGVEATALAFRVRDDEAPTGAVGGWHSPASGTLRLEVVARDRGLGLESATAYLDGAPVDTATFGDGTCADLSPGSSAIDLPFGRVAQSDARDPNGDVTPVGCAGSGTVTLSVDTNRVADGAQHTVAVTVSDVAGNTVTRMSRTTAIVNHPPSTSNVATLNIGNGGIAPRPSPSGGTPTPGAGGGVAGASASSCVSPRLSMRLAQKPLRIRKGVPVLRARKAYRFKGRVTCVIGGRRRAAPRHVIVDIFTQRGRKRFERNGMTTDPRGRLDVLLAFKRSRTLVFRVTGPNGRRDEVRIKLSVRLRKLRARVHARWFRYVLPRDEVRFASLQARRVPKRARIKVRCSGGGCPRAFHRNLRPKRYHKRVSLMRGLAGANLRPGAAVRVTISKRGYRGIGKLYCIRDAQRVKAIGYRLGRRHPSCR